MRDDSIVINMLIMMLFLFVFIIVFAVISGPAEDILNGIMGITGTTASAKLNYFIPFYIIALRIGFALLVATPVVWFVSKIFHREPAHYYNNKGRGGTF